VKEFILRMKNNKDTGYDGIPAKVWKVFCTMRDQTEMLTDYNKIENGRAFPPDWKTAIMRCDQMISGLNM
jgi:hypothetical protein